MAEGGDGVVSMKIAVDEIAETTSTANMEDHTENFYDKIQEEEEGDSPAKKLKAKESITLRLGK